MGELKDVLCKILLRMMGGSRNRREDLDLLQRIYALVATRLQIGQLLFDFASKLVPVGFAHLTHFEPERMAVADVSFLLKPMDKELIDCGWRGSHDGVTSLSSYQPSPRPTFLGHVAMSSDNQGQQHE